MNLENEVWKIIPEYPLYEISSYGQVRRIADSCRGHKAGYLLVGNHNDHGYAGVTIRDKFGKQRSVTRHRLVASAFLDKPTDPTFTDVNHKNGIRDDNRVENLEWISKSLNRHYSIQNFDTMHGEKMGNAKLTKDQVIQIHDLRMQGKGPAYIGRLFNITPGHVSAIIGRKWRARELKDYPTNYPPLPRSTCRTR